MEESSYIVGVLVEQLEIIIRLCMAMVVGSIIGLDRSKKGRAAGVKTHSLVCIGATLVMLTSEFIYHNYGGQGDVARLGAQVISGIGFLGAGTILVTGTNKVKGLTTAASLWACACIGLAIGIGFYGGAVAAFIFITLILRGAGNIHKYLNPYSRLMELYIELADMRHMREVLEVARQEGGQIIEVESGKHMITPGDVVVLVTIEFKKGESHESCLQALENLKGVKYIQEI